MTRRQVGSMVAGVAAVGYFGIAALHGSGYPAIAGDAAAVPGMTGKVVPVLWLAFSCDLVTLGLIVAVTAWRPGGISRIVLAVAALCPLAAAGLQICFLGFIPPTALLIALSVLTLTGAAVLPSPREG